jgi:hypothetical protein
MTELTPKAHRHAIADAISDHTFEIQARKYLAAEFAQHQRGGYRALLDRSGDLLPPIPNLCPPLVLHLPIRLRNDCLFWHLFQRMRSGGRHRARAPHLAFRGRQ